MAAATAETTAAAEVRETQLTTYLYTYLLIYSDTTYSDSKEIYGWALVTLDDVFVTCCWVCPYFAKICKIWTHPA